MPRVHYGATPAAAQEISPHLRPGHHQSHQEVCGQETQTRMLSTGKDKKLFGFNLFAHLLLFITLGSNAVSQLAPTATTVAKGVAIYLALALAVAGNSDTA